eukprot:SAG11_NODE_3882_length_2170_cov_3.027040_1_plen_154_part_00
MVLLLLVYTPTCTKFKTNQRPNAQRRVWTRTFPLARYREFHQNRRPDSSNFSHSQNTSLPPPPSHFLPPPLPPSSLPSAKLARNYHQVWPQPQFCFPCYPWQFTPGLGTPRSRPPQPCPCTILCRLAPMVSRHKSSSLSSHQAILAGSAVLLS